MRLLPSYLLLQCDWDPHRWIKRKQSAAMDDKVHFVSDQYGIDLHPQPSEDLEDLFNRVFEILMTYRIYPPSRMRAFICSESKRISTGTTIIQRILLGPVGFEVAVRVVDVFDIKNFDEHLAGFTYATLKGHPERGVITFTIRQKKNSGVIHLAIESYSRPSNFLTSFFHPISKIVQKKSNHQALEHIREQLYANS